MADPLLTTEAQQHAARNICGCHSCTRNRSREYDYCDRAVRIAQSLARGAKKALEAKAAGLYRAAEILRGSDCDEYYHDGCGCQDEVVRSMEFEAKALRDSAAEA